MKLKILSVTVLISILVGGWYIWYHRPIPLKKYNYRVPNDTLVVATEGSVTIEVISNILALAFPDKKIIFSNSEPPHLIIKSPDGKKITSKWDAPYIFMSGERYGIKRNRRNGPPIVELLSRDPFKKNHCYVPFILSSRAFSDINNIRKHTDLNRKKFLAYINSNCRKNREEVFKKAKEYDDTSEALGECSNTGKRASGSWYTVGGVYSEYIFGIAMENRNIPGYITEKIMNVFEGGAIPIFWGDSETANRWFNPESYIDVSNFKDTEQVIRYLDYLMKNPEKLKRMQQAKIFRDDVVPEELSMFIEPQNNHYRKCAEMIRREYFKQVI